MSESATTVFQFSGHETFPLRQLWLLKAVNYAHQNFKAPINHKVNAFSGERAMLALGVGKNMVASIAYWAKAAGFLNEDATPTVVADKIFGGPGRAQEPLDPWGESANTAWLVHWNLASSVDKCTAFWYVFNYETKAQFTRQELHDEICDFVTRRGYKTSDLTIKRAIEVLLRSYVPNIACRSKTVSEEFVDPLLGDLGLLQAKTRDVFTMERRARPTLSAAMFAYCLLDYWTKHASESASLDFTKVMHDVGSPGKIFRLDESSVVSYLDQIAREDIADGTILWSDQAGIRSLIRRGTALTDPETMQHILLTKAYSQE